MDNDRAQYIHHSIDAADVPQAGENAHGANEAVPVDDLVAQARAWAATITALLGAG